MTAYQIYQPYPHKLKSGDIVLVKVRVENLTASAGGVDYVPAEVLSVRDDKVEIVLYSTASQTVHWMALDKIFHKVI